MLTYNVGSSRSFPWGIETDIHIIDSDVTVRTITVMHWPDGLEEQEIRGNHLIQNYLDEIAEVI